VTFLCLIHDSWSRAVSLFSLLLFWQIIVIATYNDNAVSALKALVTVKVEVLDVELLDIEILDMNDNARSSIGPRKELTSIGTIKLIIDTVIHGYTLHTMYRWSLNLIGALWDSVTKLLLHLARKPPLEKKQEEDKRIALQTTLPQKIPNLHETANQTNPPQPKHTQHSPNSQFLIMFQFQIEIKIKILSALRSHRHTTSLIPSRILPAQGHWGPRKYTEASSRIEWTALTRVKISSPFPYLLLDSNEISLRKKTKSIPTSFSNIVPSFDELLEKYNNFWSVPRQKIRRLHMIANVRLFNSDTNW